MIIWTCNFIKQSLSWSVLWIMVTVIHARNSRIHLNLFKSILADFYGNNLIWKRWGERSNLSKLENKRKGNTRWACRQRRFVVPPKSCSSVDCFYLVNWPTQTLAFIPFIIISNWSGNAFQYSADANATVPDGCFSQLAS